MQAALAAADRQAIIGSFSRLQGYWKEGRWLDRRNRYRRSASYRVRCDRGRYRHSELSDYIAASTVGHCFDGWSYLGRATEAELAGDPGAARHLGYYAELRARDVDTRGGGDRDIQQPPCGRGHGGGAARPSPEAGGRMSWRGKLSTSGRNRLLA